MKNKEKKDLTEEKVEEKETVEENPLSKELEELKEKYIKAEQEYEKADKEKEEWKNKYYSAFADMSNLRKQVERENADFKKYCSQSLIEELIPTLDSFEYALKNEPTDEALKNYLQGFKMIHSKLLNTLKQIGVEVIDPKVGDEYDPHSMQAYSTVEGDEDNKVAEIFTKGYKLADHLIRPAGVIVTAKKQEVKEDKKAENN